MHKILIANRGEIAVRIIRTCREMGLRAVAVYSACDRRALHVRLADEACAIGADAPSDSYLRIEGLIEAARRSGADAVHPGYGFLAENAAFAEACAAAGLIFIGPSPAAMRMMGSKTAARAAATAAGVPVVPGSDAPFAGDVPDAEIESAASAIGFPLLVKAVAGGGGKGMRTVPDREALGGAVRGARSEAQSAFGDPSVYLESLIERPRHIEVQVLGDAHGHVVPFVERECSIQRRHQKIIEETPSLFVTDALRARLLDAAAAIARAAGYTGAGTVEFLVDRTGQFYFLEMNTRLQVEHPITEAVTGVDFVRLQIDIAGGASIEGLAPRSIGHAIECRIYAEDPDQGFLPSPGTITHLRSPAGPGIRDDSGAYAGWTVPTAYDALISKLVAWAPDRDRAIARMVGALEEYDIRGITTTLDFCRSLVDSPAFRAAEYDTTTVDRLLEAAAEMVDRGDSEEIIAIAAAIRCAMGPIGSGVHERRSSVSAPGGSIWARQARVDALR